jgi:SAM-dependent methyltransferase
LSWALREFGPFQAIQLLIEVLVMEFDAEWVRTWRDQHFDHRYRVTTSGFRTLHELGLSDSARESHNYRGTPVALFNAALAQSLRIDWSRFEFVDYGSGMGKALLLAARFPFRRVTGVEFSAELHEVAEGNIANWRLPDQRCFIVRSVLADASTWPLPEGDCLLYFFNPFRQVLLRAVLSGIVRAARPGREIIIVYIHLGFPEVFAEFPEIKKVVHVAFRHSLYAIYKMEPPSA